MTATGSPLTTVDLVPVTQLARQLRVDPMREAFPGDMAARAIAELGGESKLIVRGPLPEYENPNGTGSAPEASPAISRPSHARGDKVATRRAYGDAVTALGARDPRVVALDGEVSNSTCADAFAKAHPGRYFEMFIAEQQMVASAVGLSVRGCKPFASTFAAFLTRAHDAHRIGSRRVDRRMMRSAEPRNPRGDRQSARHHNRLGGTRCL